jgi:hypothetical protein
MTGPDSTVGGKRTSGFLIAGLVTVANLVATPGCSQPSALDHPDLLTDLRFSPSAFDSFRGNTQIRYRLAVPATVTIIIAERDTLGREYLVKTIWRGGRETKGNRSHAWLGDTDQGFFAPAGEYLGVITIGRRRFEAGVRVYHE